MADQKLFRARARIERFLEHGAELELRLRDGHAARMTAARDEDDGGERHDGEANQRLDAHGHVEDLFQLFHDAVRVVHAPVEDVEALEERDGDEDDWQHERELDAPEYLEFEQILRIGERARQVRRADVRERACHEERDDSRHDQRRQAHLRLRPLRADEVEESDDGERREQVRAGQRREHADLRARPHEDGDSCEQAEDDEQNQLPLLRRIEARDDERQVKHAGRRHAEHQDAAQKLRRIEERERIRRPDREAALGERVMRVTEIFQVRFHERHVRRRLVVDAQEVDADVALHVRIRPALDGRVDLELRLLVLRDGVEARDAVIAEVLRDFLHAVLLVELQLRDGFDEAEREAARLHFVDGRHERARRAERLVAGEDNLGDAEAVEPRKDRVDVVIRALLVVARTREDVEARVIDFLHLVRRHAEVHLHERLVMRLDGEHFLPAGREHCHAAATEAADEVFLDFLIRLRIVARDIGLRADDLAALDERAPRGIRQRAVMVALEEARAGDGRCLAVLIELLERRLIDGERRDARVFRLLEDFILREALALRELLQAFVVDSHVDARIRRLHAVALHVDCERGDEADEDDGHQELAVSEYVVWHKNVALLFIIRCEHVGMRGGFRIVRGRDDAFVRLHLHVRHAQAQRHLAALHERDVAENAAEMHLAERRVRHLEARHVEQELAAVFEHGARHRRVGRAAEDFDVCLDGHAVPIDGDFGVFELVRFARQELFEIVLRHDARELHFIGAFDLHIFAIYERLHVKAEIRAVERELADEHLAEPALVHDRMNVVDLAEHHEEPRRRRKLDGHVLRPHLVRDAMRERALGEAGRYHFGKYKHNGKEDEDKRQRLRAHGWLSPKGTRG